MTKGNAEVRPSVMPEINRELRRGRMGQGGTE